MKLIKLATCAVLFAISLPASADIQHLDDVIIQFSLCVGNDCVNGESFGFDTLRLKENNTRLHFDDTSTSASFPRNDWRIIANDSSNGGGSYLAIEDSTAGRQVFRVEAGARANALYVEDDGDIGIGTNTPAVDIDVKTGNTPTLRLQQDGSSGFTAQTWDLAGNEANFFIRDATNGSRLPFKIIPGAATNALVIQSDGDIALGTQTAAAGAALHIENTSGNDTDDFVVTDGGKVGVGTTAPAGTAEIIGSNVVGLKVANTGGGVNLQLDGGNTGNFWNITAQADAQGGFVINNNDGVGTEFSLSGAGNLTIEGQLTTATTTYPDYVFEDNYDLMTLEELRIYIGRHGHLPNIPSQAEVDAAGGKVNMTHMQMLQLEKIEELTLYTLAQQKTIQELNGRLAALEVD